jgi:hypothetical protein
MTPKERADKILKTIDEPNNGWADVYEPEKLKVAIAAQIEEAEREATKEIKRVYSCDTCFLMGFEIAREKATKIADAWESRTAKLIAVSIGKLEPEEDQHGQ